MHHYRRRTLPLLTAGACAVLLAACSSGGTPPAKATGTGTPAQNYTAHALNLVSSDFPSTWKTLAATGGPNVVRSSLNGCAVEAHAPKPATAAVSSNFLESSTGLEVGSQVQAFDHDQQAVATATAAGSTSLSSCLAAVVKSGLSATVTSKETVSNVTAAPVDPHNSAPHAFAQQVVATIAYPGKSGATTNLEVYVLVDGFAHGPVTVEAEFENPGSAPSDALVSSTMATLVKRAQA
jgi:hypothetical protein